MQRSHWLALLAGAHASAQQAEMGLNTLAEALAFLRRTGERHYEAEIHRLRGKLLLKQSDEAEAEASFHKAVDVARRQAARSWELRATVSLCRLLHEQGRIEDARQRLSEMYDSFTEGFDTPDLRDARALFKELS